VTSLFSGLQKLNKEATEGAWVVHGDRDGDEWVVAEDGPTVAHTSRATDASFIAECRNSLPAVLNLIEATVGLDDVIQWIADEYPAALVAMPSHLFRQIGTAGEAVAVFVSGQEEPK
jgi:hypothetical protein